MINVRVTGIPQVLAELAKQQANALAIAGLRMTIGSDLVYVFPGLETGFTARGRLARRAGGAWMAKLATEKIGPQVPGRIARALAGGPNAVNAEIRSIGADTVSEIRRSTPVRSGAARDSIRQTLARGFQ